MISLKFRKAVDTSKWDQSFVDGAGKSVTTVTPSADDGLRDTRHALEDRNDPNGSDTRRDPRMSHHVTANRTLPPPAETAVREAANLFLDRGRCQLVTDCQQPMAPDPDFRQSRLETNPKVRHALEGGSTDRHPWSRTELLVSDVAAWLVGIEPFKPSTLRLNRSTSGSPSINADSTTTLDVRTPDEPDNQNPNSTAVRIAQGFFPDARGLLLRVCDPERLRIVYARLRTSGFYLGRMSTNDARRRLAGYPVGTFLLRDSSDSRFLFSLSVQTERGTTSIRIQHDSGRGLFRLDSDPDQSHRTPTFHCVLLLLCHYIRRDAEGQGRPGSSHFNGSYVLRESTGRCDTPALIRRPLESTPGALAHLCRKRIHRSIGRTPGSIQRLHLNPSLKNYLADYPYDI